MYVLVFSSCSSEKEEMIRNPRLYYLISASYAPSSQAEPVPADSDKISVDSLEQLAMERILKFKHAYPFDLPYENYLDSIKRCDAYVLQQFVIKTDSLKYDLQLIDSLIQHDRVGHGSFQLTVVPRMVRYTSTEEESLIVYGDTLVFNYSK